ncbi:MAG TPA: hypothetical protein ENN45_02080 [Bacteroidetes bacterium]|nr:hypothetical protein [Bacteroidota bacterium]
MKTKHQNIWIWLQNNGVMKAILDIDEGTVKIYDEDDNLILKRTGLNKVQIKQVENYILQYGAKKLSKNEEPFKFL